ncbi:MAG: hypothetical protein ACK551_02425 [Vampirovibrionales bacterium]
MSISLMPRVATLQQSKPSVKTPSLATQAQNQRSGANLSLFDEMMEQLSREMINLIHTQNAPPYHSLPYSLEYVKRKVRALTAQIAGLYTEPIEQIMNAHPGLIQLVPTSRALSNSSSGTEGLNSLNHRMRQQFPYDNCEVLGLAINNSGESVSSEHMAHNLFPAQVGDGERPIISTPIPVNVPHLFQSPARPGNEGLVSALRSFVTASTPLPVEGVLRYLTLPPLTDSEVENLAERVQAF